MKRPKVFLKELGLPAGAWQVCWYGRLAEVDQAVRTPFIATYLTRVEVSNGRITRRHDERAKALVPVSDLPALPLGTVLQNKRVIHRLSLHEKATTVEAVMDLSRTNLRLRNRLPDADDGTFLFRRGQATIHKDADYDGLLMVVGASEGDLPHVVPCSTVFQFFWARSSKWAQMMVDGRFLDYPRYIFNPDRSYISNDGTKALIWLRQWMEDLDVKFISTLAFDEYALQVGADIYKYLAQPPRDSDRRCLRALPPYQGVMKLRVHRHRIATNEGDMWLVQRIESCDYQPILRDLRFDRDNDGRTLDEAVDDEKIPMDRESSSIGPLVTVLEGEMDLTSEPHSSAKLPDIIHLDILEDQFPGIDSMSATKLPQTDTEYKNKKEARIRLQQWLVEVSTLIDASSSTDLAPYANIRGGASSECLNEEDHGPLMGDFFHLGKALIEADAATVTIDNEEWTVRVEHVIPAGVAHLEPFFLVPRPPGEKRRAWHFCDKENRIRKRALCLRITYHRAVDGYHLVRYILDLEGRAGQSQNRILFFWNKQNTNLANEKTALRALIDEVSKARTTDIGRAAMRGLEGRLRKHTQSEPYEFFASVINAENDVS